MSVVNLDLACNRNRKDADGNRQTDFFSVNVWGKLAEIVCQHCVKGDQIIVYGRMESRKYTAKDGSNRTAWEVQADGFEFCGSKNAKPANPYTPDITVDGNFEEGSGDPF